MTELTKKDVIGMLAVVKSNYFYAFKDMGQAETKTLIDTWHTILGKEPKEIVMTAFYRAIEYCKMPPTIADIRENIDKIYGATTKSDQDLWNELRIAMRQGGDLISQYGYTRKLNDHISQGEQARLDFHKLYDNLDEHIKEYLGGEYEFSSLCKTDSAEFEKGRFFKAIGEIKQRLRTRRELPNEIVQLAQEGQKLLEGGTNEET